ncbi:hypothetical protein [Paludisphaera mucosa]|uniref:Uncharacterized protein n=1 Tax=Paludisphaera mucosa TaxID=3030827 RepID=A0ABT6FBH5_9BACT|nr:hypothetical protein [Paludisphaera mucosa]MDG3004917.1 hypothetical protein [Paludisphaera mucosa]
MTRRRRPPSTPLAPAAFLALLALAALAPRSAEAGCASRGHAVARPGAFGLGALAELSGVADARDGSASDAPPPGRVPPCSGPSCSGGPGVPLAPAIVAPDLGRELWCNTAAAPRRDRTGRSLASFEDAPLHPSSAPAGVDRPPRRPAA